MSTRNTDEDTAYNRDVLHAIAEFRDMFIHLRNMIFRISTALNNDLTALEKQQAKAETQTKETVERIDGRLTTIDERQAGITDDQQRVILVVTIGIGVIVGAVIVLSVLAYLTLKKA